MSFGKMYPTRTRKHGINWSPLLAGGGVGLVVGFAAGWLIFGWLVGA